MVVIVHHLYNHWIYTENKIVISAIEAVDETKNWSIILLLRLQEELDNDVALFAFAL
jgi:hypothetical protein